jgi:rhodanese-related sulfurtransferase
MNNLNLPLPEKITFALQVNTNAIEDNEIAGLPTYTDLTAVKSIARGDIRESDVVVDVREVDGDVAGIEGSLRISVRDLKTRVGELDKTKRIVCVSRVGVRSATICSLLGKEYGFGNVVNLRGGLMGYENRE